MTNHKTTVLCVLLLTLFVSAVMARETPPRRKPEVRKESFGKTGDGRPVDLYTLTNSHGVEVRAMTYGGIIVSLRVPDKSGKLGDIVLGHDKLDGYLVNPPYFGVIVGTLCQPHRQWQVHPRRREIYSGQERWPQFAARRAKWIQQAGSGRPKSLRTQREWRCVHLSQQGRRRRLSRQPQSQSQLHADRRKRADPGLRGDHRQSHANKSVPAQLFQSGGRRQRRHPRASTDAERRPLHARGQDSDPDR